jgi:hypothetical protein
MNIPAGDEQEPWVPLVAGVSEQQTRAVRFWVNMALGTIAFVPVVFWRYHQGTGIGVIDSLLRGITEEAMLTGTSIFSTCWLAFACSQIAIAERHPGCTPTVIAGLFYFILIGLIAAGIGGGVIILLRGLEAV